MSGSANVRSIQALSELKGTLKRFVGETQSSLNAAEIEIRSTLEWLAERQTHWRRQVQRWQDEVERARIMLHRCQDSGSYDHRTGRSYSSDCRRYEEALFQAQRYLRQAEAELHTVQQANKALQQAVADYQGQARRLNALLNNDVPKGTGLLSRSIAILESYVGMNAPSGGTESSNATTIPTEQATTLSDLGENTVEVVELARTAQKDASSSYTGGKTVAMVAGEQTISGWTKRKGYVQKTDEVMLRSNQIGYQLKNDYLRDQGVNGRYNASHAEKQAYEVAPNQPIGVSRPMCLDCRIYFRLLAQHVGESQVISDPDITRIFYSDGRVIVIRSDNTLVTYDPDTPAKKLI